MIRRDSERGFSNDIPWLKNLLESSAVHVQAFGLAWVLGSEPVMLVMTGSMLWPNALFVWRVVLSSEVLAQLAAVLLPLWPVRWGLFGPHQPSRLASMRGGGCLTEETSCWLRTLVLGQACCQLDRRLPHSHHDPHVSVATGILVCTLRVNIIPSRSVSA